MREADECNVGWLLLRENGKGGREVMKENWGEGNEGKTSKV